MGGGGDENNLGLLLHGFSSLLEGTEKGVRQRAEWEASDTNNNSLKTTKQEKEKRGEGFQKSTTSQEMEEDK